MLRQGVSQKIFRIFRIGGENHGRAIIAEIIAIAGRAMLLNAGGRSADGATDPRKRSVPEAKDPDKTLRGSGYRRERVR